MTDLRRSMSEDLQLRGLSAPTQEMDVRAGRQRAPHVHKSPAPITEDELRPYGLPLQHVRPSARRATPMALGGLKCFFEQTLPSAWTTLTVVRPPRAKTRPVIVRITAVRERFRPVRWRPYRPCRPTIDACGVRRQEGTHRRVPDLARARLLRQVRHGTGGQDRDVPLPHRPLELLRPYGVTHRHPLLSFPAPGRGRRHPPTATTPLPMSRRPAAVREARKASGVNTRAGGPTLRHAWATHRLEAGVHLRLMHASRGHHSPPTTAV